RKWRLFRPANTTFAAALLTCCRNYNFIYQPSSDYGWPRQGWVSCMLNQTVGSGNWRDLDQCIKYEVTTEIFVTGNFTCAGTDTSTPEDTKWLIIGLTLTGCMVVVFLGVLYRRARGRPSSAPRLCGWLYLGGMRRTHTQEGMGDGSDNIALR